MIDKYLLVMSMGGVLNCYDCESGKELWKERVSQKFSASPLVSEGRAYFQNDDGETFVIKPGEKMEIVAQSQLKADENEIFRAALVPSQGQIFIRSTKNLYCIGAGK